ncbi:hypothetical protein PMY56_08260 [Clostridium tertium]|uniref:Uncharacterized protein n=2 Tax=Clostridium tertium TaxID=1559 RepID=A0A9X3XFL8_9CLOT|nr:MULTISPECIES: hypothetical protein [Clostridium]MBP1867560.1 magnesium-transporting ATPase (P-type) [Clostridium tertium]MBS5306600.1 hypothetical protein [Clostridium sp.]MBS6500496.1 hypothetical protein [Clostridium sp.]MDB1922467.1 hypothetical protein [Clostridium tertium]MDB1926130.1 hypothetical protein [Clostridium tertium]
MLEFSYLCLLLFIITFILYLEKKNIDLSPKKIRLFVSISLMPIILRCLVLLGGVIIEKQRIIYFLRYYVLLNYFSIPLIILSALYIFLRNEKLKFNRNYIFMIILGLLYVVLVYTYKFSISITNKFGFIISLENGMIPILIYLIILASLAVFILINLDKPFCNKVGMRLLLVSLILYIVEYILLLGGISIYPYPIIGEVLILFCLFKSISTFK